MMLAKIAKIFLLIVGVEYVLLGVITLFKYFWIISDIVASVGLVAPIQVVQWAVKVYKDTVPGNESYVFFTTYLLAILSIAGGSLAIFGAVDMLKGNRRGYTIWLFLILLAFGVAVWDAIWGFLFATPYINDWIFDIAPIVWALLYFMAFRFAHRGYQQPIS